MSSASIIRSQVESRLAGRVPAAFGDCVHSELAVMPTGVAMIDAAIGGIPRGGITEIAGPDSHSTGRKSLAIQLLARATREQFCAWIDATDSFDPRSSQTAGVNLKRLLWIRCGGQKLKALEHAFKAADLLLQRSGGFELVIVDLAGTSERFVRKIPVSTWFRYSRVAERLAAALVFITPCPVVGTCSNLTLVLSQGKVRWSDAAPGELPHVRLSLALDCQIEIRTRRTLRKPSRSVSGSLAQWRWA